MSDETKTWWEEPVAPTNAWGEPWAPPGAGPDLGMPAPYGDTAGVEQPEAVRPDEDPRTGPEADALRDQVVQALKNIDDPELGMNIVDLGLVYGVDIYSDQVYITYTLTTIACLIGPMIEAEMQRFLADIPGIERMQAEMVFRPPWTPEMMSEEAKAAFGFF
jgi:metal-sulfur cluster biosynthetic enzyme